jgi:hypothetical protein
MMNTRFFILLRLATYSSRVISAIVILLDEMSRVRSQAS